MNEVRITGFLILLTGIAGHFLVDTEINGFWISGAIGGGGTL